MNKKFRKSISILLTAACVLGTGAAGTIVSADADEPITLTFEVYSKEYQDYFEEVGLAEKYKEVNPNVTIEIIADKDDVAMAENIKIKGAAGELPDIMDLKKEWMLDFKEDLVPLNDLECVANSPAGEANIVDGNVLAIKNMYFTEFVYYKKSIFEKYGISVPQTWDEFIAAAETIRDAGEYIPILLGAKDSWTDYPFNEFMPILESGSGTYRNEMAEDDSPFDADKPFAKAYEKIDRLYKANVFGPDPLGMGWDQVNVMFGSEGAMMVSGQWYLGNAKDVNDGDLSDVGVFFLPTRDDASEPQNYLVEGTEGGLAVSKNCAHPEEAKALIEWMNSEAFLPGWCEATSNFCVFDEFGVSLDPIFDQAYEGIELNQLALDEGNEKYNSISNAIQFDVKGIGQQMLAGEDYTAILADLNEKWAAAKAELE